ncbi:hypothetical protein TanjilG_07054 [Lupinus angustifolius]|uniref:Uncharacterized protein n=1 Tax=Lupinus angustifolius TaxID=3871 RepID=A0A4P1QXS9_LUPAN|nr:hypothetical protein TanjilG_07054 [Lupinus angustifolius]
MENISRASKFQVHQPRVPPPIPPPPPRNPELSTVITMSEPVKVIIATTSINLDINIHGDFVTIYPYPFNRDH